MIEKLFIEISAICKRYEEIAKLTGENFNIFQILGLQTSEVRLHSAFLAELLNSKGLHGQGDKFLSLFVKQLKGKSITTKIDTKSSEAFVEYYSGKITEDGQHGGKIDILIKDKNSQCVIIENKIYAGDQPQQLKRYNNFSESTALTLLYLNLFGGEPSAISSDGLEVGKDFYIISYQKDILEWLDACMKEATALPIIRETILQYIHLIKWLTNQTRSKTMSNEIKELLKNNPEYFKNIPSIQSAYEELKKEINDNFFKELGEKLKSEEFEVVVEHGYWVQLHAGEDRDGIHFAFRLVKDRNNERCNLKEEQFVIEQSYPTLFKECTVILKDKVSSSFKSDNWSLAWYYPTNRKRLEDLEPEEYLSFSKNEKMLEFINQILVEARKYFSILKENIPKSKATESEKSFP